MIKQLFEFVRGGVSISLVFLAVSGYLLFNSQITANLAFVILSTFFLSSGAYGYNTLTDRTEDSVNGRTNFFASSVVGAVVVFACFVAGFFLASFLGIAALWIAIAIILSAVAYSGFRLKRYLLIKNVYTAFSVSLSFILGAAAISSSVLSYYFSISLFFFMGSIISDMRDISGDKKAGIRTFPVLFGIAKTKKAVYALLGAFLIISLKVDYFALLPLILSIPVLFALVSKDKHHMAHFFGGFAVFLLMLWSAFL